MAAQTNNRNGTTIKRIASILIANSSYKHGMTLDEIADATDLNRTTIHRIVAKQPGFARALTPSWPFSYYYSHAIAEREMQDKAMAKARNNPNGELVIPTALGNAIIRAVDKDITEGNNAAVFVNSLANIGTVLDKATGINPVTSGARFANDPELQKEWFDNFVQLLLACRIVYVHGINLLSSDEFQQPDFWKIFITTNQD